MSKSPFIRIPTSNGEKFVNISSIALVEQVTNKTVVTLKEKNVKGDNIIFEAALPYPHLTGNIDQLVATV